MRQPFIGPRGDQHHGPAAHAADHKAYHSMYDGVIRHSGEQRQRHGAYNPQIQAPFDKTMRTHGIPCTDQVAKIIHGSH
ncbi:hypothetical protein D3C78_853260 [compost metagenome]